MRYAHVPGAGVELLTGPRALFRDMNAKMPRVGTTGAIPTRGLTALLYPRTDTVLSGVMQRDYWRNAGSRWFPYSDSLLLVQMNDRQRVPPDVCNAGGRPLGHYPGNHR